MLRHPLYQLLLAFVTIGVLSPMWTGQALAVEVLRVGVDGNVSWEGTTFGGNITTFPAEYIVGPKLTQVGSAPGNLIDLSILDNVVPSVLIKTVVDVEPELLAEQIDLVNQMLLDALSPLSGIASLEASTQGNLSIVFIEFQTGEDLGELTQQVSEALDPIRPEGETNDGFAEEQGGDLSCVEEIKIFELQLSASHVAQGTGLIPEDWGECETYSQQVGVEQKTLADCYKVVCKNRETGEQTQRPGRQRGKLVAARPAAKSLQEENAVERLPPGTKNPVVLPVALSPIHIALGENVAQRALEFNGEITAPSVKDLSTSALAPFLLELIEPGGAEEAFERKAQSILGTFIVLDLGTPIGINRIRFYPRNTVQSAPLFPFQNDFLRQFELLLHDGRNLVRDSFGRFSPRIDDYVPLLRTTENDEPVFDLEVKPARLVRYIRLKSTSSFPYELDEFEAYGQGFVAASSYISPIFDLAGVATWGNINWTERVAPLGRRVATEILIRTRTGSDATPIVYKRKNIQRLTDPEQPTSLTNPNEPLGREEYLTLQDPWIQGAAEEDLQNWSPWSSPYDSGNESGGTSVLSPGPRRYIQFSIEFQNSRIDATKMIEQLTIEYLVPPLADDLIAEIYPREVEAFETVQFIYAVKALMDIEGVAGFDAFRIETPTRVLGIDKIQIMDEANAVLVEQDLNVDTVLDSEGNSVVQLEDGSLHALPYSVVAGSDTFAIAEVSERNFTVKFPHISRPVGGGDKLLKIFFRSKVLLYSTVVTGQAILSAQEGSIQRITPGNAAFLGEGDLPTASGITVLSPAITRGSLIGSLTLSPNPFTPNGDGVNDVLDIEYDILTITREAKISLHLFDLSGRMVRALHDDKGLSGHYDQSVIPALGWDGRDAAGDLVSPGIYLLRVEVKGDARDSQQLRPVAVVY
jgi:hypothetical protein